MNSNPDNVFNLTGNTINTATTLTVPRSKYITARLLELRQLIDIHQDDLPTRRKTYKKYLERYRKVRFELCRAAYASTGRSNLTPFQLSSKVEALAEKELTLRELVKMLSSNYEWMVEKVGALKKEEERLSKDQQKEAGIEKAQLGDKAEGRGVEKGVGGVRSGCRCCRNRGDLVKGISRLKGKENSRGCC
jgi:hypothetical protein